MIDHEEELEKIPDLHYKAINHVFEENLVPDHGLWLEFGVFTGGTMRRIARRTKRQIFGFDSFQGLPEAWEHRDGGAFPKGTFNLQTWRPQMPANVTLIEGWYCDTLPLFVKDHPEPVTFIHIDSDIYSSAKEILTHLGPQITSGCIIVFDELVEYDAFMYHEWKAWWEFVDTNQVTFEWIGGNRSKIIHPRENKDIFEFDNPLPTGVSPSCENVALRIINNPLFKDSQ